MIKFFAFTGYPPSVVCNLIFKMLTKYKAIFFDAGGTLLHPYPSVGEIYAEVGKRYGSPATAAQLEHSFREVWLKHDGLSRLASHSNENLERNFWKTLVREVFDACGGVNNFDDFFHELYDLFARPEVWRLYPDVENLLKDLKKQGKKMGIVSNWDSRLFHICEGLELNQYFDFIIASAVFGASKPSTKIFEEALRRSGVNAAEAVHIGDSFKDDIEGAHGAGLSAILIDRHPKSRPTKHKPTITNFTDLRSN